jgi:hypothetical protein
VEEIIIHTVDIRRQAELKHFEIPLPRNCECITGLWYKIRLITTGGEVVTTLRGRSTYNPEVMIGELSLISNQQEGVFYFGNLILDKMNVGFLDYTNGFFPAATYNRTFYRKPLDVKVMGDTASVNGHILDNWGVLSGRNVQYEVDIYLFVKLKEKTKSHDSKPCS